jgi:tetratricopeptide (TPR) repeat protein
MITRYKTVSIIYGGNGKEYAERLSQRIQSVSEVDRYPIEAKCIMESILTRELFSDIVGLFKESEFCVAFLTSEDVCLSQESKKGRLRQNVVFELGMALAEIGRDRCILLSDFNCRSDGFDMPSDMNSLEVKPFEPENIDEVIDEVIDKIVRESSYSLHSSVSYKEPPRYDHLLNRETYYLDCENMVFCRNGENYGRKKFLSETLNNWSEECRELKHFDEKCIFLLERIVFMPMFGNTQEVKNFMQEAERQVSNYDSWDAGYYNNGELLNFTSDLLKNVIEYTKLKMTNSDSEVSKELMYEELEEKFTFMDIPEKATVNPLILVVYYDYMGLTCLKLHNNYSKVGALQKAGECFEKALKYSNKVDMAMKLWEGFLTYNLARTLLGESRKDEAEARFRRTISIRAGWKRTSNFPPVIRNAISSEYFIAKLSHIDMLDKSMKVSKEEIREKYEKLEIELKAYIDSPDEGNPLLDICNKVTEQKNKFIFEGR